MLVHLSGRPQGGVAQISRNVRVCTHIRCDAQQRREAMPATRYKIWAWGSPVGEGATASEHIGVSGVAKKASTKLPYTVANELICMNLARAVLLPVPPGFLIERNCTPYYVSMNFNLAGEDLPPADAKKIVSNHAGIAWGIILFDIWVANTDRHNRNIVYDQSRGVVQIFDHSHAFFYDRSGNPRDRLEGLEEDLGTGVNHCLAKEIKSFDQMPAWTERFVAVPNFYVEEIVQSATQVGLPDDAVQFCTEFLCERKSRLRDLVEGNRNQFPSLEDTECQDLLASEASGVPEQ